MNYWDLLNDLEATTTSNHAKQAEDHRIAMANYVAPTFVASASPTVEFTPEQQKTFTAIVRKAEAKSEVFSTIRRMRNQGKSVEEILAACKTNQLFLTAFGRHVDKRIPEAVSLSDGWDEHKNRVVIFFNLLCHVYQASSSKKIQKDTKHYLPLLLLIPALTSALGIRRTAISAQHYIRNVGSMLALSDAGLEGNNQQRKWKAYEKQGYITFTPGKKGGDSNRVEILSYEGPELTVEQKLEAAALILAHVQHQGMSMKLAAVLNEIAGSEDSPRYGNCDLTNRIQDLLTEFAPIAGLVVENRKAERLIDSADYGQALADAAEEITEKVTAMLKAGRTLIPAGIVEAPQSHAEPLLIQQPTSPDLNDILSDIWDEEAMKDNARLKMHDRYYLRG